MRYFGHSPSTIEAMLKVIGKKSIDDLFSSIPKDYRLKKELNIPRALDELELRRKLAFLQTNNHLTSFLGAGATEHFVPAWISQQLQRAEWYTSYTPYQPELSQGTLQAIFEFQSIVASLFDMEVANASLYDGATSMVEALLMATRLKHKKSVLISSAIHPEYKETLLTYFKFAGINVKEIPFNNDGSDDIKACAHELTHNQDIAAIALSSPNFFGIIQDLAEFCALAHEHQALMVGVCTDMSSLAIIKSFGEQGVDIAVGEGLGFLPGLYAGGPGVGLMATRKEFIRQIPGRLAGKTTDKNGNDGYVLTLSAREQHIRREKATSNICTNHNLMALAFAMCMSAYGKSGLKKLALINLKKTLYFRELIKKHHIPIAFTGAHYNETVIKVKNDDVLDQVLEQARSHDIIAGLKLSLYFKELKGHLLVCTTELHEDNNIEKLASILGDTSCPQ